ncbi:diacylglycerol kinase family protein [Streptomyces sparsogenes]|uniref:Transcription regulator n=1 Tax=Streptomyces sparsogenes DSM 40356 TaxID=1331668 RepID=A0A1R1SBY5_9ACTN|nr:diacylglycerol kinase family protein [Streptomyces sparsogenes]OMI35844.1 Transcription regulator [Streptomyces sparsogenes DSM 40356]
MRHFTAVVKPAPGGPGSQTLIPLARRLREAGADLEVEYSRSLGHARDLALRAAGRGRVVLGVGGDGLAGRVVGALAGTDAVAGIVPAGRGNDFARALGLPGEVPDLAELLLRAHPVKTDAIEIESAIHQRTTVLGSVYTGVDALANRHANTCRALGAASYYAGALRAITTWKPARYRITIDGTVHERTGFTVVAANSGYYGFGRQIAPNASVHDGVLDVIVIHHASRLLFFAMMNDLKTGQHIRRPQVEILHGHQVRIEADRHLPYGADGEVEADLPVTARVLPQALNLLC